jgi:hypothetical protein
MAKSYKKKIEQEELVHENDNLSKKEQYDLEKKKKMNLKEKEQNKKNKVNKKNGNHAKQTNLGARIFAVFMLVLMVGSVIISTLAYVIR